jgi:hypothetical protein
VAADRAARLLDLTKVTRTRLFREASTMAAEERDFGPSLAVVIAQASSTAACESAMAFALTVGETAEPLQEWIGDRSTLASWSPANGRIQRLWKALTGETITTVPGWREYMEGTKVRHDFVHRAQPATREQAEDFIDAAERIVAHLLQVTLAIEVERRRSGQ